MRSLLALALTALPAAAETAFDSTGVAFGVETGALLAETEEIYAFRSRTTHESFEMEAEGHPFAGLGGVCEGFVVAREIVSGGGLCTYEGAEGTAFVSYEIEGTGPEGELVGTWSAEGGLGTLAGLSGGGRFASFEDAAGAIETLFVGAVTLP